MTPTWDTDSFVEDHTGGLVVEVRVLRLHYCCSCGGVYVTDQEVVVASLDVHSAASKASVVFLYMDTWLMVVGCVLCCLSGYMLYAICYMLCVIYYMLYGICLCPQ
jgi:hypothetical protein